MRSLICPRLFLHCMLILLTNVSSASPLSITVTPLGCEESLRYKSQFDSTPNLQNQTQGRQFFREVENSSYLVRNWSNRFPIVNDDEVSLEIFSNTPQQNVNLRDFSVRVAAWSQGINQATLFRAHDTQYILVKTEGITSGFQIPFTSTSVVNLVTREVVNLNFPHRNTGAEGFVIKGSIPSVFFNWEGETYVASIWEGEFHISSILYIHRLGNSDSAEPVFISQLSLHGERIPNQSHEIRLFIPETEGQIILNSSEGMFELQLNRN